MICSKFVGSACHPKSKTNKISVIGLSTRVQKVMIALALKLIVAEIRPPEGCYIALHTSSQLTDWTRNYYVFIVIFTAEMITLNIKLIL